MATIAGRSILRSSSSFRTVASKIARPTRSATHLPKQRPTAARFFRLVLVLSLDFFLVSVNVDFFLERSPVEMSCCVDSLLPMYNATASARMTSMLLATRDYRGWLLFLNTSWEVHFILCYSSAVCSEIVKLDCNNVDAQCCIV